MRRALIALLLAAAFLTASCSSAQVQGSWCAFHAWRLIHDVRTHHKGWAVVQGTLATYHCTKALKALGHH